MLVSFWFLGGDVDGVRKLIGGVAFFLSNGKDILLAFRKYLDLLLSATSDPSQSTAISVNHVYLR